MSIDETFRRVSELSQRLEELPEDAYEERARIRSELSDLRAEAAAEEDELPTEAAALEHEAEGLRQQIDQIVSEHTSIPDATGGTSTGRDYGVDDARNLNEKIDENEHLDHLKRRLARIEEKLGASKD